MYSELLQAWAVYYLQPKYRMDARIVKAVVTGNIDLAKEALAASEINDLNRIFKVFGLKPYTLLDAAIAESKEVANADLKRNIQEIISQMRRTGAKTYKELTNVASASGKPPFAVSRKRGRNLRGIALSRKNRRHLNNNSEITNKNLWHEGL